MVPIGSHIRLIYAELLRWHMSADFTTLFIYRVYPFRLKHEQSRHTVTPGFAASE
jgi:hypothetical protein